MTTKWTKKRRANRVRMVIFIIALVVFVVAAVELFHIYREYRKGTNEYSEIAAMASDIMDDADDASDGTGPWTYFYNSMKAINEDYVGWIRIEDTVIDYPIVQFTDNDYYLKHSFYHEELSSGTLFIDCNLRQGMESKNVIVYGHNMRNGSMFAALKKFRDEDFYEGHKTFEVYTEAGFYTYEIFAIYETSPVSDTYTISFADDDVFMEYVEKMRSQSMYDTSDVSVEKDDKIITLSTCVNNNVDRLIVQAVRREN